MENHDSDRTIGISSSRTYGVIGRNGVPEPDRAVDSSVVQSQHKMVVNGDGAAVAAYNFGMLINCDFGVGMMTRTKTTFRCYVVETPKTS